MTSDRRIDEWVSWITQKIDRPVLSGVAGDLFYLTWDGDLLLFHSEENLP